jgi:hypothetical protein
MHVTMPLFTGSLYEGYYIGGFLWGFLLQLLSIFYGFTLDILQWFLLTLSFGLLMQMLLNGLKVRRFRKPVTNTDLLDLFEEVRNDLGKGAGIQLWQRDIDRAVFLSAVTPIFKAILFSESTIGDILRKREIGKVVLAQEVLRMERLSPLSRLSIGLLGFTFFSIIESLTFLEAPFFLLFSIGPAVIVIILVVFLVIVAVGPRVVSRISRDISQEIEDLYNISPAAAVAEVLLGIQVSEEMIEEIKRDEREGKPTRHGRALKNGAIAALIATPIIFIIMYILTSNSPYFLLIGGVMTAFVAFAAFIFVFLFSELLFLRRSMKKPRSTDWDFQNAFTNDIQGMLNKIPGYERIVVRGVRSPSSEQYGLVALRLKTSLEEEVLFGMLPQMLEDIHELELAGPFILSELRRKDIEKKYNRISYGLLGFSIPYLAISVILSLVSFGPFGMVEWMLPTFGVYFIIAFVPLAVLSVWKRNIEIKSDVEIAQTYPRFRESLQTLIKTHHTLPYGMTSYRSRLERIDKQLGRVQAFSDDVFKIDLD